MFGYWISHIERMPLEGPAYPSIDRLKSIVRHADDHLPSTVKIPGGGVEPGVFKTLADITKLPFTRKVDLRDNYPTACSSAPKSQAVRYHVSSGTTGKPTVRPLHQRRHRDR